MIWTIFWDLLWTVLFVWLAPVAWVVYLAARDRRAFGQPVTPAFLWDRTRTALRWPRGVFAAARGK